MADVFISYAHEDQPFVRRMVPALEAEGFSVWWDHAIPPGQSWDTFIARGIEEAKACIVVWSQNSVGSDWVKEEATLAKEGGKFLPVQADNSQPPVGFRRIQAADFSRWNGNASDPQWQLLVREAQKLVRGGGAHYVRPQPRIAPRPAAPPPAPTGEFRPSAGLLALIGVIVVGVILIVANNSSNSRDAQRAATTSETAAVRAESAEPALPEPPGPTMVGTWRHRQSISGGDWSSGSTNIFSEDGAWTNNGSDAGRWSQNGDSVQFGFSAAPHTSYFGTITGDRMAGRVTRDGGITGQFEATRQRGGE